MDPAGDLPKKRGPDGGISHDDFKILMQPFKAILKLSNMILLIQCINNAVNNGSNAYHLFHQLQKEFMIELKVRVSNPQEECR